jgi:hypothetical protein
VNDRIIHKAGCPAPDWYGPGIIRKATSVEPIRTVANGRGGTMRACSICGMNNDAAPADAEPTFLEPGREQRFAKLIADGEARLDGEPSPRLRELIENALRERAQRMVADGLTDAEVDKSIMYSDHADRVVIWQFVNALRAQDVMPREVMLTDLPDATRAAFLAMKAKREADDAKIHDLLDDDVRAAFYSDETRRALGVPDDLYDAYRRLVMVWGEPDWPRIEEEADELNERFSVWDVRQREAAGGNASIDLDPQAGLDYSASPDSDEHEEQATTFGQRVAKHLGSPAKLYAALHPEPGQQPEAPAPPALRIVPPAERIATPEQAIAAYEEHRSDRKAAKALGISRTQLRRLRGADK